MHHYSALNNPPCSLRPQIHLFCPRSRASASHRLRQESTHLNFTEERIQFGKPTLQYSRDQRHPSSPETDTQQVKFPPLDQQKSPPSPALLFPGATTATVRTTNVNVCCLDSGLTLITTAHACLCLYKRYLLQLSHLGC